MDFEFTEEQKMLREASKLVFAKEVAPLVEEAERSEKFPTQLMPLLGDLGYLGIMYSPEYGGSDMGMVSQSIIIEELGRVSVGIASGIMIHSGLGTSSIYHYGSEDQKKQYLMPAIEGQKISAFALTEPNAGSDAASIESRATRNGDDYIINGNKVWITNAPIADMFITAAYTDRSKGPKGGVSLFIVEKDTAGLVVSKMHKFCMRSSETGEVVYENVRVPKENIIGEEGKGFPYLMEALAGGRIAHAARSLGLGKAAYEASLDYAKTRKQFGQPIGKFQAIAFKLAGMALDLEAATWLVYHAAWVYGLGRSCSKEAAMAKLFSSEMAQRVTAEAMQIWGSYAMSIDSPINRYLCDSRPGSIVEGTSEIQQLVISREIGLGR
jgi:alkylation response protein AidB-like acyl-CoA dehydrogenase